MNNSEKFIMKNYARKSFTMVTNDFLKDKNLSNLSKYVGIVLLSKPSNWKINPAQIKEELGLGRDKVKVLFEELIEYGYMYKHKNKIKTFGVKEQVNVYYFSDSKKILKEMIIPLLGEKEEKLEENQLRLEDNPNKNEAITEIQYTENQCTENQYTENQSHINKIYTNKELNKKETKLTKMSELRNFMRTYLQDDTVANILNSKPNITIEEFQILYKSAEREYKQKFCNSIDACIVLAVQGKWKFRANIEKEDKVRRILQGNINHYETVFIHTANTKEECLEKYYVEVAHKYDKDIVEEYYKKLAENLEKVEEEKIK